MLLTEQVFKFFLKNIKMHKNIYIGFSGGVDSSVLLDLCRKNLIFKYNLKVIHINHYYSPNNHKWTIFCKYICNCYKIGLYIYTIKNKINKNNFEENFRRGRFRIFLSILKKNNTLLLAHNYDDLLETVIMRFFRGCGIYGLDSIKYKSFISYLNIVRPLLYLKKKNILNYAVSNNKHYIIDFSNFNNKFLRNYIRNKIKINFPEKWINNKINNKYTLLLNKTNNFFYIYGYFFLNTYAFNYKSLYISYIKFLSFFFLIEIIRMWLDFNECKMPTFNHIQEILKLIFMSNKCINTKSFIKINNYLIVKSFNNIHLRIVNRFFFETFVDLYFFFKDKKKKVFFILFK